MSESEIKVGDRFLVEVEIRNSHTAHSSLFWGRFPSFEGAGSILLSRDQLLAGKRIEPALKMGDKVRVKSLKRSPIYNIIHIHSDFAWLCTDSGLHGTSALTDLERVL